MIIYIPLALILLIAAYLYISMARHFKIFDHPNERSSHQIETISGGGIIVIGALLIYFVLFSNFKLMLMGAIIVGLYSFWDDIDPRAQLGRLGIQMLAVILMLLGSNLDQVNWYTTCLALILILGWMNTFNFMDGINGIAIIYSGVSLATCYLIPELVEYREIIRFLAISLLILGFFNVRSQAKLFIGDAGSMSIAYVLAFLVLALLVSSRRWEYILIFSVYGIDSVVTIFTRFMQGDNVFTPHRKHLYQFLANEMEWSHLSVAWIYGILQAILNLVMIILIMPHPQSSVISIFMLISLVGVYATIKHRLLNEYKNAI
jgi:UDP-N-acetylmuramyl pentapeptide phosphotransferase/UDP-N-acetylglucosamine-1-phosphate transferase